MSPAKSNKTQNKPEMANVYKIILSGGLFIMGFNFSYNTFFKENPLYGVPFLAETLISLTAALIGFYIIPMLLLQTKDWLETLIIDTVSDIVRSFWDQQSKRMNDKRREKDKQKSAAAKEKFASEMHNAIVLDTSILVDGRILDVVKTGFLDNTLIVPSEVMDELHTISDSAKKLKRERGRRGLDIAKKLKSATKVLMPELNLKEKGVDRKLLKYCKNKKLPMMTLDFNLNKLSQAKGVKVLNMNDLVDAVKVSVLPGEDLVVEIVQEGKEKKQGLGYMPDGTMLVVEAARDLVGTEVNATVQRVIQSSAGKIIFCKLSDGKAKEKMSKKK